MFSVYSSLHFKHRFKYRNLIIGFHEILDICGDLHNRIDCGVRNIRNANDFVLSKANLSCFFDCDSIWNSISSWRFFRRRDSEHFKAINQFFRLARTFNIIKTEDKKIILRTSDGLSMDDLSFVTHAIAHLQDYTNIRQNWNDLNEKEKFMPKINIYG